jgi:heterodisulfide reductase subunit C
MPRRISFAEEVANLLYATEGNPVHTCIQCGTCASSCPAVDFMDHSPREIIALIRTNLKDKVLASNTYWCCASCYQCTVRCPKGIDIAYMMYGLKRYAMWQHRWNGAVGADFSKRFVRMIVRYGRSYEPELAAPYIFRHGIRSLLYEAQTALYLLWKGRLPLLPHRVRRAKNYRNVIRRILPLGGAV